MPDYQSQTVNVATLSNNKKTAMRASFKQWAQTFLKRIGLYQRIKSSCLYDFYWSIADRRLIDGRSIEVEFYRNTLKGFRCGSKRRSKDRYFPETGSQSRSGGTR